MQVVTYMCSMGHGFVCNDSHLSEQSRDYLLHIIDTGKLHSVSASPSEGYMLLDLTSEDFE